MAEIRERHAARECARGGAFVAVVGPSGAGKDSLIALARDRLAGDGRFVFARRIVTREADPDLEDHECLDAEAFRAQAEAGQFCVHWEAHGLSYALPRTLLDEPGQVIVANVSRRALADIARRFRALSVIEVTAPPEILLQRILARGRETREEIGARLARSVELVIPEGAHGPYKLENAGPLEMAAAGFIQQIEFIADGHRSILNPSSEY